MSYEFDYRKDDDYLIEIRQSKISNMQKEAFLFGALSASIIWAIGLSIYLVQ